MELLNSIIRIAVAVVALTLIGVVVWFLWGASFANGWRIL